jgi:methionyl-tRNA synthetase
MSSSEYLNYEAGKFSKSQGIGVFGNDARDSGISADAWRFYIFYNRPEKADFQFTWKDFQEKYNGELIGNLGNLVNRTLTFVQRYYEGRIPGAPLDETLWAHVREEEAHVTELLDWAELKDAFHGVFKIADMANKAFQAGEPWKKRTTAPEEAASLIRTLCFVIKDLAILCLPYMPQYAASLASFFGKTLADGSIDRPAAPDGLCWKDLGDAGGIDRVVSCEIIFKPLDSTQIDAYRAQYSGTQAERKAESQRAAPEAKSESAAKTAEGAGKPEPVKLTDEEQVKHFNVNIALKTAKILKVEKHPEADKLYIETLDDGSSNERVILSGLVPYLAPEELLGKTIIVADNLKPRKMRGIMSYGMLLAADYTDSNGTECVEVLDCPWAAPGTPVVLDGAAPDNSEKHAEIDADCFFMVDIAAKDKQVCIGGKPLMAAGRPVKTDKTVNGGVH